MRVFRRRALGLAIPLLTLFSLPVHSQNLLLNPGFDRDLSGWTSQIYGYPDPTHADASAVWTPTDSAGRAASGGLSLHATTGYHQIARLSLGQCFDTSEGRPVVFGARFLTARQFGESGASVEVAFFDAPACGGSQIGSVQATSAGLTGYPVMSSEGLWLPATATALSSPGSRSMRVGVTANSVGNGYYWSGYVDAIADDVYAMTAPDTMTTWILPSAGRGAGAGGSLWTTTLTLANPGEDDALVTLKFLGHDADGRSGPDKTVFVRAGSLLEYPDILGTLFGRTQDYGAIRITSSSPSLVVQSETSTPWMGGTVGQALPAFGASDFAGATPKTIAPIREDASFRTNLVLANATEIPVIAHVVLYASDGAQIGARDVDLPPLGMTQISRVASALGAATLDAERISVSTPTPGGLLAAYVSAIDNVSNDPRTVLPRDPATAIAETSVNLLTNPGFDRDLSNWEPYVSTFWNPDFSMTWGSADASGSLNSGSLAFHANAGPGTGVEFLRGQCVPVTGNEAATFGAKFLISRQNSGAHTGVAVGFFKSSTCGQYGDSLLYKYEEVTSLSAPSSGETSSQGEWRYAAASTSVPSDARSMAVYVKASAAGSNDRTFPYQVSGYVDGSADNVFVAKSALPLTRWLLPSAAWAHGTNGAYWVSRFTLINPGSQDASVTLKWLGHDADGRNGRVFVYLVRAGETLSDPVEEWVAALGESWGGLLATADVPVLLQSETSTPLPGGGTVGQALSAFGAADFAGATPKTLAPIRENTSFRTNLVLANATEIQVTAHVHLFAADGTQIGSRDVHLPPLGMTQINRVASALGATSLDAGRISVSTPTPGGLVAAYASVIDNVTNDPRTLLSR